MSVLTTRRGAILAAAVLTVVAVGGAAVASIPGGGGVIHGCYAAKDGQLRVIDADKNTCPKGELAISWNQTGPVGPTGATGPEGPPGPSGTLSSLDDLDGVACTGQNGKPASVHLVYGTGIEAPVTILCITHLVANPGTFTLTATDGSLQLGLIPTLPLPTGWSVTGQIDTQGKLVTSGEPITLPDIPWSLTGTVTASGTLSFNFSAPSGSIDPASGSATLSATAYGVVTVSAFVPLFGSYNGTCKLGTAANPISIPFSTASPGTPYSQTDGSLTLAAHVTAPQLTDCNPALPGTELANLLAGSGTMQFSGTVNPIILAP
jgi:hypothetical protein